MKTLEAFWHWYDNEDLMGMTPDGLKHLSEAASYALGTAVEAIDLRIGQTLTGPGLDEDYALGVGCLNQEQRKACRELSLAFCEALERMHEAVPAVETTTVSVSPPVTIVEYTITWAEGTKGTE